ncbi:MAG: T9SS type A sorting domain-containing protein [Candidatus Marinimicrobia bacterium]|nr:T9SS type A sorting domain-containing protein [Candidatus Neomarinimicrobiota bacterium]
MMKPISKIMTLIILFSGLMQSNVFASRLFSMQANAGEVLTAGTIGTRFQSFGDEFQAQGHYHPTGWAMLAYQNERFSPENNLGMVYRGNGNAWDDPVQEDDYDFAQSEIMAAENITTVMSHLRKASSGCGSGANEDYPDNPHPWVWYEPGIAYTFAHNGTIDEDEKAELRDLIGTTWIAAHGGLQTFDEAGCGGDWLTPEGFEHVIDSELYFFWLMQSILDEDGDVLQGLKNALTDPDFHYITNDSHLNFTFSDGMAIWAFRRAIYPDSSPYNENYEHTLYYSSISHLGFNAVSSQELGHSAFWTELDNRDLVYLPRTGNAVVFPDFNLIAATVEVKKLSSSWNWVGFPVLEVDNTSITTVLETVSPNAQRVDYSDGFTLYSEGTGWDPNIDLTSIEGYQLLMSEEADYYNLQAVGTRVASDTQITLDQGENWVPYFIQESQEPLDALPANVLDRLVSLKAQDWYMFKKGTKWIYSSCSSPIGPCRTLDYGEMYMLNLSPGASIFMTYNTGGGTPPGGELALAGGSFEVQELNDYSALAIDTIEDPESVTEIGIFIGDDCIGAQRVTEFPVYIQAYNGEQSLDEVSFQVVRDAGLAKGSGNPETNAASGLTFREHFTLSDLDREVTEGGFVVYHADIEQSPEPLITETSLLSCFPNPFNPSTSLRYELARESLVSVVVYNIQGRVVENLYRGEQSRGQHELTWNASTLESGLYFVVFKTGGYQSTQKMMLIK